MELVVTRPAPELGTDAADHPHLLVVGATGRPEYRAPIIAELAASYPLWLVSEHAPDWALPHIAGWTGCDLSDLTDPAPLLAAVTELAGEIRIGGALTLDDDCVLLTSYVVERLGLPGMTPETTQRCRDKALMRSVVQLAGIAGPDVRSAGSAAEAVAAAEAIGLPVVLKPRAQAGSRGVIRVDALEDLPDAYAAATAVPQWSADHDGRVLVEEFLDGPNVSLGSAVVGGVVHPLVVARVTTACAPYFTETDHLLDGHDPLFRDDAFLAMVRDVHAALGITCGTTLSQWCLTSRGPRLIEVNARLGGDLVQQLGGPVNGVEPVRIAADVAMGVPPRTTRTPDGAMAITFLLAPHDLVVTTLGVHGSTVPGTQVELLAQPGDTLLVPPAGKPRYAYVVAHGSDVAECVGRLRLATATVTLQGIAAAAVTETAV
ncbi:MAG TPA: ATP-grasp domain-containing protein [Kribbellaceae bacterium]